MKPISGPAAPGPRPGARDRCLDRLLGDRLDQRLPDVDGVDEPLGAAPGGGGPDAGGERRGVVEPVVGQAYGVGDRVLLPLRRRGVGRGGDGLAGEVDRDVPVQRAVIGLHQRLDLTEELAQVTACPAGPADPADRPPKNCSKGVPLKGFWPPPARRPVCGSCVQRYAAAEPGRPQSRAAPTPPYAARHPRDPSRRH